MTQDPIPFLDLVTPHREFEDDLLEVARRTFRTGNFIGGTMVTEFEEAFARFCETRYCVGAGSGTDALRFALIAAGVGPGDAVITVPNTFIATTEAISQAGALPEFVDIDERSLADPRLGQWPWPRTRIADIINDLTRLGAVVIAFDAVFSESYAWGRPSHRRPKLSVNRLFTRQSSKA